MIKKFLIIIGLLFSFNVKALCDNNELLRLKQLAEKVEFTYQPKLENISDADGDTTNVTFDITANNLNQDLKVLIIEDYYLDKYQEFKYQANGHYTLNGFANNDHITVTFKAYVDNDCSGQTVYTKKINLPYYNLFINRSECKQYPDFKYCQEYLDSYISESTFTNALTEYLNSPQEDNKSDHPKKDYSKLLIIAIATLAVIIIIIVIVVKIKKNYKKNKL